MIDGQDLIKTKFINCWLPGLIWFFLDFIDWFIYIYKLKANASLSRNSPILYLSSVFIQPLNIYLTASTWYVQSRNIQRHLQTQLIKQYQVPKYQPRLSTCRSANWLLPHQKLLGKFRQSSRIHQGSQISQNKTVEMASSLDTCHFYLYSLLLILNLLSFIDLKSLIAKHKYIYKQNTNISKIMEIKIILADHLIFMDHSFFEAVDPMVSFE